MTVYVEYAFLDNFTMDFLLLFCACLTLKLPFRWWRIALGAFVGSVLALPTVYVHSFWVYLCKAACLFLMCFVAVGWGKKLFWHILLTLAYTFVTGGAIVGVFNLLHVDYANSGSLFYNMPVPLFVYFFAVLLVCLLCYFVVTFVKQTKKVAPFLKRICVILDRPYTVLGFCDSGNTVNVDGTPVCFVTKKFGTVSDFFAKQILAHNSVSVVVSTLTETKTVTAVAAQVVHDGKTTDVYLALPAAKCNTSYQLLLSGEFM